MEQKQNVTLGPRYQVRLEDLRDWHVLEITCGSCGREGVVYPSHLRRRLPGYTRLLELEKRFACRACGNRTYNTWRVMAMSRNV